MISSWMTMCLCAVVMSKLSAWGLEGVVMVRATYAKVQRFTVGRVLPFAQVEHVLCAVGGILVCIVLAFAHAIVIHAHGGHFDHGYLIAPFADRNHRARNAISVVSNRARHANVGFGVHLGNRHFHLIDVIHLNGESQ